MGARARHGTFSSVSNHDHIYIVYTASFAWDFFPPQPNEREKRVSFDSDAVATRRQPRTSMMLRQVNRRSAAPPHFFIATILLLGVVNRVTTRSIEPGNFTIDRSEVPARYVFELDEVREELSEINKRRPTNQGYLDSGLMFDMPIAVAVFSAVMLLVCCFCCLRCAVTYDGIKRGGFYGNSKKSNVIDIAKRLKLNEPIKK